MSFIFSEGNDTVIAHKSGHSSETLTQLLHSLLWHFCRIYGPATKTGNRRILWAASTSGVVTEAGAAVHPELLTEAGGLVAAGGEGGTAEAVLHVHHIIHQLVGAGNL